MIPSLHDDGQDAEILGFFLRSWRALGESPSREDWASYIASVWEPRDDSLARLADRIIEKGWTCSDS